ncbi:MAG TPA: bifunctional DNA-binding transcriptional regulator/O6-methylguanine-DNA methyltransferase Ada [Polyangiaceae bacterium]|nr:bifunctional DNA-binding transcriptional regulator/O6-methylguanine-DNA methyltransferase Ada [Polyangiaceae bacterium]
MARRTPAELSPHAPSASVSSAEIDAERWQALRRRDPALDGQFWYAVSTTGIYCRPSCSSRLPRRENVQFYAAPQDAERAGFRACKRCKPSALSPAREHAALVARACQLIDQAEQLPPLEVLAAEVGLSRFHFHRVFKSVTSLTPKAYADAKRATRLQKALQNTDSSVTRAAYDAGFNSSSRFYTHAKQRLGMTPSTLRARGAGQRIHFAVAQCWLGAVLIACSERGVCHVAIGDDPEQLLREFQERFAQAELKGADRDFEAVIARVLGCIELGELTEELPLDVRGTAFQQRVWQALRAIPRGTTTTYSQIAEQLGQPAAVRAVAGACAANSLAVLIPCHRVVRTDGSLSGYRWGIDRKRALLERESKSR